MSTASPLEIVWVAVSVAGVLGALLLLRSSARVLWRVLRSVARNGDREQAFEEAGNDLRDAFLLSFFVVLGVRALYLPPSPTGASVVLTAGFLIGNALIGVLCWLRWRRRA